MTNNQYEEKGNWLQQLVTKLIVLNPPNFEKSDYKSIPKFKNKLIFIEKNSCIQSVDNYIPCLFYRNPNSSNYLLYFHGNSEHIFQIEYYGLDFRSYLDMNIIIVEYPGYSIYSYKNPDSNMILSNALIVYDWIKNRFQASDDQIFVCGRSLGTASAIYLSSKRKPRALFLISAFTSLKNIGKDYQASFFMEQIFNSYKYITNINSPILLIHGEKDTLINYKHSLYLYQEMNKTNTSVEIKINENMTHNDFSLKDDIILPIKNFIDKYKLRSNKSNINFSENELNELYKMPQSILKMIESKLFDINNFKLSKTIEIKNAIFFVKSNNNIIIFSNGSKILMYNLKNYSLEDEIDIGKKYPNAVINSLYLNNNQNIICGTDLGDIIVFEKVPELEQDDFEDLEETYIEIKHIPFNEEIYKIDKFFPDFLCILTKNTLKFYDDNFNEKTSIKLPQLYTNFVQISKENIALLSYNHLSIYQIKEDRLVLTCKYTGIKSNNFNNILIATNKYIIVGGRKTVYLLNYIDNIKTNSPFIVSGVSGEINYIYKIDDISFLASTSDGKVLDIQLKNKNGIDFKEKKFTNDEINSLFLKSYKSILLTTEKNIQVWTNSSKENKDEDCTIF